MNGKVKLCDLWEDEFDEDRTICLTANEEEMAFVQKVLRDFVAEPLSFNLSEMLEEEELLEMAELCGDLCKELG